MVGPVEDGLQKVEDLQNELRGLKESGDENWDAIEGVNKTLTGQKVCRDGGQ